MKEAMKLALEALEQERENYRDWDNEDGAPEYIHEAITALREALAEPPAQRKQVGDSRFESWFSEDFEPKAKGTKQQMREAYEAGMNDPSTQPAQQEPVAKDNSNYRLDPPGLDPSHQKPVAWWIPKAKQFCLPSSDGTRPFAKAWEPLYTSPPAQQEPVTWGVDWGKAGDIPCVSIIKRLPGGGIDVVAVEYAPYEYNPPAQQEPDAFVPREAIRTLSGGANHVPATLTLNDDGGKAVAVFLSPQPAQRKPLTLGQKQKLWSSVGHKPTLKDRVNAYGFAIEAAHNIKEQP